MPSCWRIRKSCRSSLASKSKVINEVLARACAEAGPHDVRVHRAGVLGADLTGDRKLRFKGHATFRARARIVLANGRVHRADIGDGACVCHGALPLLMALPIKTGVAAN